MGKEETINFMKDLDNITLSMNHLGYDTDDYVGLIKRYCEIIAYLGVRFVTIPRNHCLFPKESYMYYDVLRALREEKLKVEQIYLSEGFVVKISWYNIREMKD